MRINKNIMKKILLIFTLLVLLTGCTAPRVYKKNRFTKQFQEADSMFSLPVHSR
ncbi:lipoprotein [Phocaeicola sp.]|uniref:lipoprotein n=1 Tax=Phocaeicola sp. TaxID=2773926 RepID=UPI002A83B3E6|nr:lipoprotein [Phocaeicola sp.]